LKEELLHKNVQNFIQEHLNEDATKLILKGSPFENITVQELVEQIISKKKCEKKLPTWFHSENIYYPNKLNIEQTSSEITAKYKSELVAGNSIIDITGGFGVDCFYFAKRCAKVVHCELNKQLSQIVSHNFAVLIAENITTFQGDGIAYIKNNSKQYDWIYADPSRRNDAKEKVFLLQDCLPNIPLHLDALFEKTNHILLKLSPVLDITASINALKFVKEIHVVAVQNEVKELLFILEKGYEGTIPIKTINIKNDTFERFESVYNSGVEASFSKPKTYLFEPNAAILKAGLFNDVSYQLKIYKIQVNSHLYTSNNITYFPGRSFKICHILNYDKKQLKKIIPSQKANITTRNFPQTVAQIRKKIGFKEGGNHYLFFTTDLKNKHIVLVCEKI
jgi:hypothetical protein